jgi:biopolymer transport protein ExbB/TolQ
MTFTSTLDLLYLVIAIAVLWVAAMLTWMLFEAAIAMRRANRFMKSVQEKAMWMEKKILNIGDRLESSSSYINAIAKGGRALADYMRSRHQDDDDEEDEKPRRRTRRR